MKSSSATILQETPPLTRGRRSTSAKSLKEHRKHPRLRGEDMPSPSAPTVIVETPPLTRGRPERCTRSSTPSRKHPRLRGEDSEIRLSFNHPLETPPLTRGRPCNQWNRQANPGNTPAYAGKTRIGSTLTPGPRKHPRLRGEDRGLGGARRRASETPPLTRGRPKAP